MSPYSNSGFFVVMGYTRSRKDYGITHGTERNAVVLKKLWKISKPNYV